MNNFYKILVFFCHLFFIQAYSQHPQKQYPFSHGAIVKGDTTKKELALVFTADEYGEGLQTILQTLKDANVKGNFFFTGRFYRNRFFQSDIKQLHKAGHYLGPHSDQHLLYCDWTKRDSLLVTKDSFSKDLQQNIAAIKALGIQRPTYFIPPYEWWNDSIAYWSRNENLVLFNFSPGIRTAADYTWPEMGAAYKSSDWLVNHVEELASNNPNVFNGAIILIHAGIDPRRKDKFYHRLPQLLRLLKQKGYQFKRIDELITLKE